MFCYNIFVNILKFCTREHLFSLLLVSKYVNEVTWKHLIDFLRIDLNKIFIDQIYWKRNYNSEYAIRLMNDDRIDSGVYYNILNNSILDNNIKLFKILLENKKYNLKPFDEN